MTTLRESTSFDPGYTYLSVRSLLTAIMERALDLSTYAGPDLFAQIVSFSLRTSRLLDSLAQLESLRDRFLQFHPDYRVPESVWDMLLWQKLRAADSKHAEAYAYEHNEGVTWSSIRDFLKFRTDRSSSSASSLSKRHERSGNKRGSSNGSSRPSTPSVKAVKPVVELDSGSTVHISGDNKLFSTYLPRKSDVPLADIKTITTLGTGILRLSDGPVVVSLPDAVHIANASTLLSLSTLEQSGWTADLRTGYHITVTNSSLGFVMTFARDAGRYVLSTIRQLSPSVSTVIASSLLRLQQR
ncbi:hypothetical protein V1514DRAFT_340676 [Lipomyces japonicus]|uniref:uncharacterized protein n=1 Tax=Lipomyces japonicus TaxID=56871 RepID=UPI0034CE4982